MRGIPVLNPQELDAFSFLLGGTPILDDFKTTRWRNNDAFWRKKLNWEPAQVKLSTADATAVLFRSTSANFPHKAGELSRVCRICCPSMNNQYGWVVPGLQSHFASWSFWTFQMLTFWCRFG